MVLYIGPQYIILHALLDLPASFFSLMTPYSQFSYTGTGFSATLPDK
jgi:hypothetical protein